MNKFSYSLLTVATLFVIAFSGFFGIVQGQEYPYKQTPTIANTTLTLANTEYSQVIPQDATKMILQERTGASDVKYAYTSTESGTLYFTLKAGMAKTLDIARLKDKTIYMQSPDAAVVVEFEFWQDE